MERRKMAIGYGILGLFLFVVGFGLLLRTIQMGLTFMVILIILFSGWIFGFVGYYFGQKKQQPPKWSE